MGPAIRLMSALAILAALLLLGGEPPPRTAAQASPPTVTRITPNYDRIGGGAMVSIEGTGFSTAPGATRFVASPGPTDLFTMVTCDSDTHCNAVSVAQLDIAGGVSDSVRAQVNGVAGPPGARFAWYNVPVLESLDPASGPAAGGNSVTLRSAGGGGIGIFPRGGN